MSRETPAAPPAQVFKGELRLRGAAGPVEKSAELFPESTHPSVFLSTAFVLLGAGALPEPSKQLAVEP